MQGDPDRMRKKKSAVGTLVNKCKVFCLRLNNPVHRGQAWSN